MPDPSGLSIQTTGGALPDVAVAQVIQRKAQRLLAIMGDAQQPQRIRETAKLAFDSLQKSAKTIGLDVSYNAPAPSNPPSVLSPSDLAAARAAGINTRGLVKASDFQPPTGAGPAPADVGVMPPAPAPPLSADISAGPLGAAPAFPNAADLRAEAAQTAPQPLGPSAPAPAQAATVAPTPEPLGPPQSATRLPDTGIAPAPPLDLSAPPPEPDSADTIALRAALAAPAPTYQRPTYTRSEGIALAFLAGLKGVNEALPFIKLKEEQATRAAQTGLEARGQTISGLHGLAAVGEAGKDRAEAMQLRRVQMQTNEAYRQIQLQNQHEMLLNSSARVQIAQQMADTRSMLATRPSNAQVSELAKMGNLYARAQSARALVDAGYGGPVAARMPWGTGWPSGENIHNAAQLYSDLDYLAAGTTKENIGSQMSERELALLAGAIPRGTDIRTKQLVNLDAYLKMFGDKVRSLGGVYDPLVVRRAFGHDVVGLGGGRIDSGTAPILPPLPPGLVSVPDTDLSLYDEGEAP